MGGQGGGALPSLSLFHVPQLSLILSHTLSLALYLSLSLSHTHTHTHTHARTHLLQALRERVGLGGWGNDKFIVGVVSRLTGQKGVPLIKHAAFRAVERGGQFVLLGSAPDPKVQVGR